MRIIKFRVWDPDIKKMEDVTEMLFDPYGGLDVRNSRRMGINGIALGRDSLMQFTGLLDKNGKEIYERDIVSNHERYPYEVVWHEEWAKFVLKLIPRIYPRERMIYKSVQVVPKWELIGNIYENPELTPNKTTNKE